MQPVVHGFSWKAEVAYVILVLLPRYSIEKFLIHSGQRLELPREMIAQARH